MVFAGIVRKKETFTPVFLVLARVSTGGILRETKNKRL
jgi:hypothetical protein